MNAIYHHNNYLIEIERDFKEAIEESFLAIQHSQSLQDLAFHRGYLQGLQKVLITVEVLRLG